MLALAVALSSVVVFAQRATQAPISPDVRKRIEQQVRVYAEAPPEAQITIGEPEPSEFPTYDSVPVTIRADARAHTFHFLISRDRTTLFYVKSFDLTQDPYSKVMHAIDLTGRPARGATNPQVTLVMYDDYECPYCAHMYITAMNEVMNHYRDRVRIVLKDFPLMDAHPWATDAALAANCAAAQSSDAYWAFADYVHTHQQAMTAAWKESKSAFATLAADKVKAVGADADAVKACVARGDLTAIERSKAEGHSLGVSATPGLFVNGEFFEGELSPEQLRAAVDRALAETSKTASK
jgi:protein-disulfide isomerase